MRTLSCLAENIWTYLLLDKCLLYLYGISNLTILFRLARELHRNLVVSECRIKEHATSQKYRKIQEISDGGGAARSLLHKKVRQRRASPVLASNADDSPLPHKMASFSSQSTPKESDTTMVSESNVKKQQLGTYPLPCYVLDTT